MRAVRQGLLSVTTASFGDVVRFGAPAAAFKSTAIRCLVAQTVVIADSAQSQAASPLQVAIGVAGIVAGVAAVAVISFFATRTLRRSGISAEALH